MSLGQVFNGYSARSSQIKFHSIDVAWLRIMEMECYLVSVKKGRPVTGTTRIRLSLPIWDNIQETDRPPEFQGGDPGKPLYFLRFFGFCELRTIPNCLGQCYSLGQSTL